MIVFDRVTRSFFPGDCGVFDLHFLIETGEAVVLTGKSGAGKTTIMKLMIKEYTPESGNIYLDEIDYSKLKNSQVASLRRKIGVVFQDFLLINELTAWENIALPLAVTGHNQTEIKNRVKALIKLVGLENKENLFPNQLSGGEAGRVGIARALALAPELIFADEPTGNLDPQTSLEIAQILKKINQLGTTLILATHDPIIVDLFADDRVIKLDKGKVIDDTKPKDPKPILDKIKAQQKQKRRGLFGWLKRSKTQQELQTPKTETKTETTSQKENKPAKTSKKAKPKKAKTKTRKTKKS